MTDSSNTEPRRAVTGDEADAYSPIYRRWYHWRPGERAAIKRRTNRRERRERRDDAQHQAHEEPADDLMSELVRISQGPHPNPGDTS